MQIYEGQVAPPGEGKIAIVVAKFNKSITQNLLDGCVAKLKQNGVRDGDLVVAWVPGAFEIPTIAQRFADDETYQAVICLACVIKGETSHDEHINRAVSLEIARIGAETGIPVIFGMLTCNTKEQALARAGMAESSKDKIEGGAVGNKGSQAAEAALEMLDLLIKLPEPQGDDEPDGENIFYQAKRYQNGDFDAEPDDDDLEEADDEQDRPARFGHGRPGPKERGGHGGAGPQERGGHGPGGYKGGPKGSGKQGSSFGKKPGRPGPSGFKGGGKKGKPGGGKKH